MYIDFAKGSWHPKQGHSLFLKLVKFETIHQNIFEKKVLAIVIAYNLFFAFLSTNVTDIWFINLGDHVISDVLIKYDLINVLVYC